MAEGVRRVWVRFGLVKNLLAAPWAHNSFAHPYFVLNIFCNQRSEQRS